jgi:uncharacterized protein YjbJ (UPF0337 family)
MFIVWILVGVAIGAGGMYAFHAKVKKALEQAKTELEERVKDLKDKL